jgi:predicted SAM-dependent methyltransferase
MFKKTINILNKFEKIIESYKGDDYLKLSKYAKNKKDLKVHFGCGPRVLAGWINIDLHFEPYEEYLKYYGNEFYPKKIRGSESDFYSLDVTEKGIPLDDKSASVIFHEDFIEHISQKQQIIFLAETLRVLKKGGVHRINTPNLRSSMRDNSNFKIGLKGVHKQEWDHHVHINVLTPNVLKDMAEMVGYSRVVFNTRNKSVSNHIPKEYRPDINDRPEDGNIFADLIK